MLFKDFPIAIKKDGGAFSKPQYEPIDDTLIRINNWVEDNEYIVLNIETLLFPALDTSAEGTGAPVYKAGSMQYSPHYYQVFRAWFKESKRDTRGSVSIDELV